jgi:hypothetical protein
VWLDPRAPRSARALASSALLYVVLVSTSMQTWYFCLPVSVAVLLGLRARVARLALAYSAAALPALYLTYYLRAQTPGWVFLLYASAPLVVLLAELPIVGSAPALDCLRLGQLRDRAPAAPRAHPRPPTPRPARRPADHVGNFDALTRVGSRISE